MEAAAAGKVCPAGVHYADAPTTFTADQRTAGSSRPKDTIVDGEMSREFTCSVVQNGDKFAVSGSMNVPAFDKDNHQLSIPTQIQLKTTIGKDESGAMGSLTVADEATAGIFYQSTACTFSVKSDSQNNSRLAIDSGKAWGSVICPSVGVPSDPSASCSVDVGYFILENCAQK